MSFPALSWAARQKLPSTQKLVLLMLAERHNKDTGQCNPSHELLAEDCGLSRRSVLDQISKLADAGYLRVLHRVKDKVKLPNQYVLNLHFGVPESVKTTFESDPYLVVNDVHKGSAARSHGVVNDVPEVVQHVHNGSAGAAHKPGIEPGKNQEGNTPQPPHRGDSRDCDAAEVDSGDRKPTPQGAVCVALKSIGVSDVNPSHSKLLTLLNAGVALETFVGTARECVARGKGSFRYILSVVENQEAEARDLAKALEKQKFAAMTPNRRDEPVETFAQRAARQRMEEVAPGAARKVPGQLSGFERAQAFMNGGDVIDVTPTVKQIGG